MLAVGAGLRSARGRRKPARARAGNFESHWEQRAVGTKTLGSGKDFDFVVLGIGLGAIPHACAGIRSATRAGAHGRPRQDRGHAGVPALAARRHAARSAGSPGSNVSGFVEPFDTWADMTHLIPAESLVTEPRAVAYFCNGCPPTSSWTRRRRLSWQRREQVRQNAIAFPATATSPALASRSHADGDFRWELLADAPNDARRRETSTSAFDTQFWTANVNPLRPLCAGAAGQPARTASRRSTHGYDNLTIAGDWTDCGFNEGCVEAAVISGRLAAHATPSPRARGHRWIRPPMTDESGVCTMTKAQPPLRRPTLERTAPIRDFSALLKQPAADPSPAAPAARANGSSSAEASVTSSRRASSSATA